MNINSVLLTLLLGSAISACDDSSGKESLCSASSQTKIIGGNVDSNELFKSVFYMETGDGLCSGVKIASDLILTAAHCAVQTKTIETLSGKISLTNKVETKELENATIQEVIVEPKYLACLKEKKKFEDCQEDDNGDIALIRLTPKKNGQFVLAANQSVHLETVADGSVVTFVGYGCETRQHDRQGVSSAEPRRKYGVRQPSDFYTSDEYGFSKSYFAVLFPTNSADAAICAGDSGSPIFVQKDGAYSAAGITSFNVESEDQTSGYDGFVNLSFFKTFIADEIKKSPAETTGDSCQ